MPRTLYLDTMLWNRLFEQDVCPGTLTHALKERGWQLAISPHVMYELAKSFRGKRPGKPGGNLGTDGTFSSFGILPFAACPFFDFAMARDAGDFLQET